MQKMGFGVMGGTIAEADRPNPGFILMNSLLKFLLAMLVVAPAFAAEKGEKVPDFGEAVQLAPFVVNGQKLAVAIHARTPEDRKYGEKFSEEVVEIACETTGGSGKKGLVIVGREGEPHPVLVIRKFLAMAEAGQLDPAVAAKAGELQAQLADWKKMLRLDVDPDPKNKGFKLTFEMLVPALPLSLDGMSGKLYQLSWAEDFDVGRVERKLHALTAADLGSNALSKYDWVFYLPPRNAFKAVEKDIVQQAVAHEKMGLFKRAALKSALFAFSPAIKTAVEGMRKGMLYMTVLRADSDYSKGDIMALTAAYVKVLMPDFKFNGGTEHKRALEAIEAQKIANAEYAKDPFIPPKRLETFDPAAYAACAGNYETAEARKKAKEKAKAFWSLTEKDGVYLWRYEGNQDEPRTYYPAGERLLVSANGNMTLHFLVDEKGAVTGVEERRERYRRTLLRKL